MKNPFELDFEKRNREAHKAMVKFFSNRIKESFLREMFYKVTEERLPQIISFFHFNYDPLSSATGNMDIQWEYEIYRNIVGIHRSNSLSYSKQKLKELEKSDSYKRRLSDQVFTHLQLRLNTSVYFRNRQFIQGDEFIFFPLPYKLFSVCIKALQILDNFNSPYRDFYVKIFNKSLAALVLIEDNLMDNAYPICRGVIELYVKMLVLMQNDKPLEMHNELVEYEVEMTANPGETPEAFKTLYENRVRKDLRNQQVDFLHYGWVDKLEYYHKVIKKNPYSFTSVFEYLLSITPDKENTAFENLSLLYKRCHGFTHGNIGNDGCPLVHYFNLTMILYLTLVHSFRMLVEDSNNDFMICVLNIDELIEKDAEDFVSQFNRLSNEMIKDFYSPKS